MRSRARSASPIPLRDRIGHKPFRHRGRIGAIYIAISILLLPKLGAATVIALIVAGQMVGSLAFDHLGLFGLPVHHLSALRVAGAVFLLVG